MRKCLLVLFVPALAAAGCFAPSDPPVAPCVSLVNVDAFFDPNFGLLVSTAACPGIGVQWRVPDENVWTDCPLGSQPELFQCASGIHMAILVRLEGSALVYSAVPAGLLVAQATGNHESAYFQNARAFPDEGLLNLSIVGQQRYGNETSMAILFVRDETGREERCWSAPIAVNPDYRFEIKGAKCILPGKGVWHVSSAIERGGRETFRSPSVEVRFS